MAPLNPRVDHYLAEGCGRCPLGGTPECKVHRWGKALKRLRAILNDSGLNEELKWSVPCYTYEHKNVVILSAFKDYCALSFFKGVLLKDDARMLEVPGENSQSVRLLRFTAVGQVRAREALIRDYLAEAIAVEKAGLTVSRKTAVQAVPLELQNKLDALPGLKAAFAALTPGRQRSYILHIAGGKQSATRAARVEKCVPHILAGKGFNEP